MISEGWSSGVNSMDGWLGVAESGGKTVMSNWNSGSPDPEWGGSMNSVNWSVGDCYRGLGNCNGWALTVDNSVESVDWVSSVGNGTDGTIRLHKGVLSLNDIPIPGLVGGVLVSGEGVGY